MTKKLFITKLFMLFLFFNGYSQVKGLFLSFNYDSLAPISRPRNNREHFSWLNSSYGFTLGGFYNKNMNDRFILSSKVLYQFRSFHKATDDKLTTFHHVGLDETVQFRLRHQGIFFAVAGVGATYRLPTSFKGLGLNSMDVYANVGLKCQINQFGIIAQFSPSLNKLTQFDLGIKKFDLKFRTIQLGVEIPLK